MQVKKVVILAGGFGTRLSEETHLRPKPMVEIGGMPILWHIMKMYSAHGVREFVICCGYKGYMIKEFFANYFLYTSDVTFDLSKNSIQVHHKRAEDWKVTLIDTGEGSMTGGRLGRVREFVKDEDAFAFTYGDGLSDIDLGAQFKYHFEHGRDATVAAVAPAGRYGALQMDGTAVTGFAEKPQGDGGLVNGGFFVLSPRCLDLIPTDDTVWEAGPMEQLAAQGQLCAYEHRGFWQAMDTLREKRLLEDLWGANEAPWKIW